MRSIVAVAVLAILSSCQSGVQAPAGGEVKTRIVHAGNQARYQGSIHQTIYAQTPEAYAAAWSSIVGGGQPPDIDFTREAVLFVASGQRPTGGWRVGFEGARKEGDTLVIDAPVIGPSPDAMVTQMLTSPFVVVAVERVKIIRVVWKNAPDSGSGSARQ